MKTISPPNSQCHVVYKIYSILKCTRLITGLITRVTRRVPHVEQELLTLPKYLSSFGHCGVCPSSFTASGYPFGIFKLFLQFIDNIVIIITKAPFPQE